MTRPNRCNHGTTLLELAVYLFIFAFITTAIYGILIESTSNYQIAAANTELQQSVQSAAYRLSRELEESATQSIVTSSNGVVGVSFESARNAADRMQYLYPGNPTSTCDSNTVGIAGMPCWHQYLCYYLDTDPAFTGEMALYRKAQTHADSWIPGTPGAPSAFQSNASLPKIRIARHLSNSGFSLTQSGLLFVLTITASHAYRNLNQFSTQLKINIRQ